MSRNGHAHISHMHTFDVRTDIPHRSKKQTNAVCVQGASAYPLPQTKNKTDEI